DFGKRLHGPFDLVIFFDELKDRLDRLATLVDQKLHDVALFFNILRDDFARYCEASQQGVQRFRRRPFCEFFGRLHTRSVLATGFGKTFDKSIDRFLGRLIASEEVEHPAYSILSSENGSTRAPWIRVPQ